MVAIDTNLPPEKLKWEVLRPIEATLGRHRTLDKYASRTIDLDLVLYDDVVLLSNELILPDPDILKRAFVAIPLFEIAPALVLPGFGIPIRQIAEQLAAQSMQPLREYTRELRDELLAAGPAPP